MQRNGQVRSSSIRGNPLDSLVAMKVQESAPPQFSDMRELSGLNQCCSGLFRCGKIQKAAAYLGEGLLQLCAPFSLGVERRENGCLIIFPLPSES